VEWIDFIIVPILETSYHVPKSGTNREFTMEKKSSFTYQTAIIISSIVIGLSIILNNGIYSFNSEHMAVVQRYNKFTGTIELCNLKNSTCQKFKEDK